jgi:hypothetical protein
MLNKLAIIVPYRNRFEHLEKFKSHMMEYLSDKGINYEIIIVQQDDAKLFNRGMLLNIGFTYAKKYKCDYVVFHDIDMLPISVDYSYSFIPIHMSTHFSLDDVSKRTIFDEYFGGVTMFPIEYFESIDGYSNKYWGWGFEDDDLFLRCKTQQMEMDTIKFKNLGKNNKLLKFNGIDSYIKSKNVINFNKNFTISICFCPDELTLDHTRQSDEFTIFSIPGYDFAISYTSFKRYNFCGFDMELTPIYLNTDIKPNYKTNITITFDSKTKIVKMYQDGIFVGETKPFKTLFSKYKTEPYFYIGVGKPERPGIPNWFRGYVEYFAYFENILEDTELLEISNNTSKLLTTNFGEYKSAEFLKTYYEADYIKNYTLTDLSKNRNVGEIIACEIVDSEIEPYTEVLVPKRRKSRFMSLKHDENGFLNGQWKDENTRWNQLRFINEVSKNHSLLNNDGLSTLEFLEHGVYKDNRITTINVGI